MTEEFENLDRFDAQRARPSRVPWILFFLTLGVALAFGFASWTAVRGARTAALGARAERDDLKQRLERAEADKADLLALKKDLFKEVKAKDEELARLKGTFEKFEEKMKTEIKQGEVLLSQAGGKLRVDLVDKVLFESGDAEVSKRGEEVLSRVGAILAGVDDKLIQVSGHTDDSPISDRLKERFFTNWELSAARATNVVRFLQEKCAVSPKRLVGSGYGQYYPVSTNANPAGRARNRRIEVLLTPLLDARPAAVEPEPAKKPVARPPAKPKGGRK